MHILMVTHEFPPVGGGGSTTCFFLTSEYARHGHDVTIITTAYKDLPAEEYRGNIRIIRVKALRRQRDKSRFIEMLTYLCSAMKCAKKLAKQEHFDVCQVFFGIPSGPVGLMLKKKYGIPYVVSFGGGDIPGAQKRFWLIYKMLAPAVRRIWRNAAFLVANSEGLRKRAYGFEKRYPVCVITNGVDGAFFTRTEQADKNGAKREILFVSRLIKGKGLQFLIPCMEEINRRLGVDVKLTVVGDGPYRGELERITRENGAEQFVSFEGRKEKDELWHYYNRADLFILPSLSEGMPNVVLEAMSMGLPVIMTPCEGSGELIKGNGLIVPLDRMKDAVIELLGDTARCEKMGRAGARTARERFGWDGRAEEYLELFEKSRGNT